ncbi:MAG TPA: hypothetical protein VL551_28545, partial [Actinospica sp.]|nr:hypothetical protein [Actinospica sp.]
RPMMPGGVPLIPVPAVLTTRRIAGGYGGRPLPDPLDTDVRGFVRALSGPADFAAASEQLQAHAILAARVLAVFGERAASLAVRAKDPGGLRYGLSGTALACALTDDAREVVAPMALLYRAAELIGVDPDAEFAAAARRSGNAQAERALSAFPRRAPADRSPGAMYYFERQDGDGFRFVFEDPYGR